MTGPGDGQSGTALWLTDLSFHLTTSRLNPKTQSFVGHVPFLDQWITNGGQLRAAGPRWFVIWGHDYVRMRRVRWFVLPAAWIGLAEDEMTAVAVNQLQHVDPGVPEVPWLATSLAKATSRLHLEVMRGD